MCCWLYAGFKVGTDKSSALIYLFIVEHQTRSKHLLLAKTVQVKPMKKKHWVCSFRLLNCRILCVETFVSWLLTDTQNEKEVDRFVHLSVVLERVIDFLILRNLFLLLLYDWTNLYTVITLSLFLASHITVVFSKFFVISRNVW